LPLRIERQRHSKPGGNLHRRQAASRFYEENKRFDIAVRLPEENRNSLEAVGNILVPAAGGLNIPLGQLAKIALSEGPAQISREDGLRRIGIELNIAGRDIGGFVAEAKRKIAEKVNFLPDTT